jgi:hypothetical protein
MPLKTAVMTCVLLRHLIEAQISSCEAEQPPVERLVFVLTAIESAEIPQ